MTSEEFRKHAHEAVDWVANYLENLENYPVKSQVKPRQIFDQLPSHPPQHPESFDQLLHDLDRLILPGITHWQHPNFHGYFPANTSYPSIIAELITAGIGAQCMIWETSPAAAELEEKMMEWLKAAMQLPSGWHGVIQDTASTATLAAILSAREHITGFRSNENGLKNQSLRVYCSTETHSSIEKAVKIAGLGSENLVKVPTDNTLAMKAGALHQAIAADRQNGLVPCCVVATLGTTGTLAFDPLEAIGQLCTEQNVWLHVDAAYAGSAMILPEAHWLRQGLHAADSFVFNPHKWLFTNFDCSAYFVKDKDQLIKTFAILPEYLKTGTQGQVNDYRDWGIPLGRRFRALKLWFVMRSFGLEGMRQKLREHIGFAEWLEEQINEHPHLELLVPRQLNMVVFRYTANQVPEDELDRINASILQQINESGQAFLTHTRVHGRYALRLVTGQTYLEERHVEKVWEVVARTVQEV